MIEAKHPDGVMALAQCGCFVKMIRQRRQQSLRQEDVSGRKGTATKDLIFLRAS